MSRHKPDCGGDSRRQYNLKKQQDLFLIQFKIPSKYDACDVGLSALYCNKICL